MALTRLQKETAINEQARLSDLTSEYAGNGRANKAMKAFNMRALMGKVVNEQMTIYDFMGTLVLKEDIKYYTLLFNLEEECV